MRDFWVCWVYVSRWKLGWKGSFYKKLVPLVKTNKWNKTFFNEGKCKLVMEQMNAITMC